MPAWRMLSAMQRVTVTGLGATTWQASAVIAQPASSVSKARPCAAAKAREAITMQPAPSETTNPRRSTENGRLASPGGRGSSPSLGRYAPFIVANPATIGSTRGKSTAPQMAASAIPWAMNIAPRISELLPVAQAVMIEAIGPGRPGQDRDLAACHVDAGVGVHEGLGKLSRRRQGPVRRDERVEPADGGAERDGHPRGHLRGDLQAGPLQGPVDDEQGVGEDRGGPVGHLAGLEEGIGGAIDLGDLAGDPDGEPLPEREAGQRGHAAFARGGAVPLAFQLGAERGNGVVSQDHGSRIIHA